jgi:hypothetical protein
MSQAFDEKADLAKWQYRLLPWAIGLLIALAIFFFISSWIQFERLSTSMQTRPVDQIERTFEQYEAKSGGADLDYLKWKTRALLERKVIESRYNQVNGTLLLRTWTRHLGFLTGMILAFMGGIFILTKLSESGTQLSGETGWLKGSLATSSPGIVLTVVGGAIMIVTLVTEYHFSTVDTPAYVTPEMVMEAGEQGPPQPLLESNEARQAEEDALFNSVEGNAQ